MTQLLLNGYFGGYYAPVVKLSEYKAATSGPCHSEFYWHNFHQGYDAQWSQYQSQNTEQNTNVYVNNSPGAYVNTAQNSNQEQGQSQEQGPSWTNPQCLNTDNVNGVCSNGCPWGQEPEGVG